MRQIAPPLQNLIALLCETLGIKPRKRANGLIILGGGLAGGRSPVQPPLRGA